MGPCAVDDAKAGKEDGSGMAGFYPRTKLVQQRVTLSRVASAQNSLQNKKGRQNSVPKQGDPSAGEKGSGP
jgi:hypothetical protein